jgi:heme oxygenase
LSISKGGVPGQADRRGGGRPPARLSGGQYLGPAIARSCRLNGDGHRFFVFPGVRPSAFRTRYRELLDEIAWSAAEEKLFLAEVSEAYRLNIAVLADLKER